LIRRSGENETLFKFHRTVKIEAGQTITVWSSDIGATHEPPANIVMKGQRFFVSDNMTTHLINQDGDVSKLKREEMDDSILLIISGNCIARTQTSSPFLPP